MRRFDAEGVRNKDCCRHVASLLKVSGEWGVGLQTHLKNLDKLKEKEKATFQIKKNPYPWGGG